MKVVGVFCALLVFSAISASSQFHASGLHVHGTSNTYGVNINSPSGLTGDVTLTLPTSSGTLLVNQGSGVSNAFLLGGNDLTATPTLNKVGSTSLHDVQLIANNQERLTLLSGTNAIATGQGTELRLLEPAGTEYTSFRAQAQTANIVYTLPAALPTVGQVLQASAVTGSDVTTTWATASGGGGGTVVFARRTTDIPDGGAFTTGLTVTLTASKVYTFTARLIFQRNTTPGISVRFTDGTGVIASCSYAFTRHIDAIALDAVEGGYDNDGTTGEDLDLSAAGATNHFVLTGMIVMNTTGGTVNVQFNKSGGAATSNMLTGSYIQLTEMP